MSGCYGSLVPVDFTFPELAAERPEGTVSRWLKRPGEAANRERAEPVAVKQLLSWRLVRVTSSRAHHSSRATRARDHDRSNHRFGRAKKLALPAAAAP